MLPNTVSVSVVTDSPNGIRWLAVPGWGNFDWLWHGFSTRVGGVSTVYRAKSDGGELNLGFTADDLAENVRENRQLFVEAITGNRDVPLTTLRQVHSCLSVVANEPLLTLAHAGANQAQEGDGLITRSAGLLIGIQTADCIPVLVADPVRRAVAAFHAGWRGTVQRVVELGVARMSQEYGSDPADLIAAIGPGIGACCYQVGTEVQGKFEAEFSYGGGLFVRDGNALRLDLIEANRRQLLSAGLRAESVGVLGSCTVCQPELFFSHRASGGRAGRMMAVIGIR